MANNDDDKAGAWFIGILLAVLIIGALGHDRDHPPTQAEIDNGIAYQEWRNDTESNLQR